MQRWEVVTRHKHKRVLHTELVLKRTSDENEAMKKYQARVIACENVSIEYEYDHCSTVRYFILIKHLICLVVQEKWQAQHANFEKAFAKEKLALHSYAELPRHQFQKAHGKID